MEPTINQSEPLFLLEIPDNVQQAQINKLLAALADDKELSASYFEADGMESRGIEAIPQLVEIGFYISVVGQSIDLVTNSVEWVDKKKKAIDNAAKIIYEWRQSLFGNKDVSLKAISAKDPNKKIELTYPHGDELTNLD